MRRTVLIVSITGCALLIAGAALTQVKTKAPANPAADHAVKWEAYHHLLMLDLREAADHAKTLHHYAASGSAKLEKDVVMKHVDELTRNLDGIQSELANEEKMGVKAAYEPDLAMIGKEEALARQDLDALNVAMHADPLDAKTIETRSNSIYDAMMMAREHHRKLMTKHGVHEPKAPATS